MEPQIMTLTKRALNAMRCSLDWAMEQNDGFGFGAGHMA
jgi:hypothetical protein